jgi:branched-chain amino acid transport system permease protein
MLGAGDRRYWIWMTAFILGYAALALSIDNDYYQRIMSVVLIWAVMGLSWNLLSGYSGLVSFGHAAFFGLGSYLVVLTHIHLGLTPWLGIPLAALAGAVAGLLIGMPTFRLRGHYFALAMLAYPLALLYVFEWLGYQEVTIPRETDSPAAFMQFHEGRMEIYVYIGLVILAGAMALTRILEQGRFGKSLLAIKQDETAAEAAGIDTRAWKLRAIMLSGAMAGAIGGFYAVVQLVVTPPSAFGVLVSAQALIVAMFGGVGTVWGPVIGAVTLVPLSAWLDAEFAEILPGIQGVLYGIAIVAVVLLAPEGVFWKIRDLLNVGSPASTTAAPDAELHDRQASSFRCRSTTKSGNVLEIINLSKSFGGLRAVHNASLSVRQGEILGIIGPNGAGKTTLFNLLNGFIRPDRGSILFNGREVTGWAPNRICRLGIGRTFQVVKPFPRMTLADNVVVGAFVSETHDRPARELAAEAMRTVGLSEFAGQVARAASNEQLRQMELARALASKPSVLLLDEILAGLAAAEVESLMKVVRGLAGLGITIVIIEHTMQAMVKLVDRFVVLDHGSVLATGTPDEITRNEAVIEAYLGRKWLEPKARKRAYDQES